MTCCDRYFPQVKPDGSMKCVACGHVSPPVKQSPVKHVCNNCNSEYELKILANMYKNGHTRWALCPHCNQVTDY